MQLDRSTIASAEYLVEEAAAAHEAWIHGIKVLQEDVELQSK